MSTLIGFADAVRAAVAAGSDDWVWLGRDIIRKTEPRPHLTERIIPGTARLRAWRGDALLYASDRLTHDRREFYQLVSIMKNAKYAADEAARAAAHASRMEQFGGYA